jgi:hypothetical protein
MANCRHRLRQHHIHDCGDFGFERPRARRINAVPYRARDPLVWACEGDTRRVMVQNYLSHMPGKHIVIVRYKRGHPVHNEWVYNGADIDTAKVLWARELDNAQNAKLISYF